MEIDETDDTVDEESGAAAVISRELSRFNEDVCQYSADNPTPPADPSSNRRTTNLQDVDKTDYPSTAIQCPICNFHFYAECCHKKHLRLFHATSSERRSNPSSTPENPPQSSQDPLSEHDCSSNRPVKHDNFDESLLEGRGTENPPRIESDTSAVEDCTHVIYQPSGNDTEMIKFSNMCGQCGRNFKLRRSLFRHLKKYKLESNTAQTFTCETCSKVFIRSDNYKRHIETHVKPFWCSECDRTFWTEKKYQQHVEVHLNQFRYKCPQCDRMFNRRNNLTTHSKTHSDERPFQCEDCPQKFKLKDALTKHVDIVHRGIRNYPCNYCDCRFINSTLLNKHVRKIHDNLPPSHICKICSRSFHEVSSLKRHSFTQHPEHHVLSKRTQIMCELCGKSFAFKSLFNQHMNTHYEGISYPCEFPGCTKHYRSFSSLQNHKKKHGPTLVLYKCDQCGQKFSQKGSLKRHLNIHTGIRKFRCKYPNCEVAFNQSASLHRHVRVHTGDTPYMCQCCGQQFNQSGGVTKHLTARSHSRCRTYVEQHLRLSVLEASKLPSSSSKTPTSTTDEWTDISHNKPILLCNGDDVTSDVTSDTKQDCVTSSDLIMIETADETASPIITFENDINTYVDIISI